MTAGNRQPRAVITGVGVVSPIGIGKHAFWQNMLAGRSGVGYLRAIPSENLPSKLAAEIRDFDPLAWVRHKKFLKVMSRDIQLGVAAASMAARDAGLKPGLVDPDRLRPVAQDRGVAFIMNDRPDLAAATGCDGVHVGQEDARYEDARALLGEDAIVGVTCKNSRHLAMEASEKGADYVAFGAFFDSATKPRTDPTRQPADLEILRWWSEMMTVPSVAISAARTCSRSRERYRRTSTF